MEEEFKSASEYLTKQGGRLKLNDQNRLEFYGLFKQATVGENTTSKPSFFEMTARAKWDAWNSLKGTSKSDAMQRYINLVTKFAPDWKNSTESAEQPAPSSGSSGGTGPVFSRPATSADDFVPESSRDLPYYASTGDIAKVKELATPTNINSLDEEGRAAIHYACDRGNLKLLNELLRLKADINLKDSEGQTGLHYAASLEHVDIVKSLLEAGANVDIQDEEGSTPLDVAEGECKELLSK